MVPGGFDVLEENVSPRLEIIAVKAFTYKS
jgi:hypothetical protein